MNRKMIPCQVRDEHILGAGVVVGAAGSGADVCLQMEFGPMWDGLVKYVTFRDALGENPVAVLLTTDMIQVVQEPVLPPRRPVPPCWGPGGCHGGPAPRLPDPPGGGEDVAPGVPADGEGVPTVPLFPAEPKAPTVERVVYQVPIPAKAKAVAGQMMATAQGYSLNEDGTQVDMATMAATAYFRVLPAEWSMPEDESISPTLSQQLQGQIEDIREDIIGAAKAADAKEYAKAQADQAQQSAGAAAEQAQAADTARQAAEEAKAAAEAARDQAGEKAQAAAAEAAQETAAALEKDMEGYIGQAQAVGAREAEVARSYAVGGTEMKHVYDGFAPVSQVLVTEAGVPVEDPDWNHRVQGEQVAALAAGTQYRVAVDGHTYLGTCIYTPAPEESIGGGTWVVTAGPVTVTQRDEMGMALALEYVSTEAPAQVTLEAWTAQGEVREDETDNALYYAQQAQAAAEQAEARAGQAREQAEEAGVRAGLAGAAAEEKVRGLREEQPWWTVAESGPYYVELGDGSSTTAFRFSRDLAATEAEPYHLYCDLRNPYVGPESRVEVLVSGGNGNGDYAAQIGLSGVCQVMDGMVRLRAKRRGVLSTTSKTMTAVLRVWNTGETLPQDLWERFMEEVVRRWQGKTNGLSGVPLKDINQCPFWLRRTQKGDPYTSLSNASSALYALAAEAGTVGDDLRTATWEQIQVGLLYGWETVKNEAKRAWLLEAAPLWWRDGGIKPPALPMTMEKLLQACLLYGLKKIDIATWNAIVTTDSLNELGFRSNTSGAVATSTTLTRVRNLYTKHTKFYKNSVFTLSWDQVQYYLIRNITALTASSATTASKGSYADWRPEEGDTLISVTAPF